MVYHGVGVGITMYHDGSNIGTETTMTGDSKPRGNGQVFVGKRFGDRYTSVSVDEIKFYNRQLLAKEIRDMY